MPELLLATKLNIPQIRRNLVKRQRLIDRLNDGLSLPLSLISSPPGFGKTTLICSWALQTKVQVGWLTLDEEDNDISRFIQYFYAAAQTIEPDLPDLELELIKSPGQSLTSLVPLINNLNQITNRFVLVLDDYQHITHPEIHNAVTYLIEHIPPQMHLMIASRSDPPFPFSRLRVRGQLIEIRAADLRFRRDEVTEFINTSMGFNLQPDDLTALESRTEGWVAGLQLAALSMQNKDLPTFIAGFTGSHEYIVDYLTDEVLNQQSESVRQFLLKTSILNRLSGALCDAVTGNQDGQHMLQYLDRRNLFISALDSQRQWYRYHRLFADLLRQRCQQNMQETVPTLHAKASLWYEHQGLYTEAIDHAIDAQMYDHAVAMIDEIAEAMLMRSEVTTLLNWIARLPEHCLDERPSLSLFYAWAAVMEGYDTQAVEKRLSNVKGFDTGKSDSFRAFVRLFQGKIAEANQLAHRSLSHIEEKDRFLRSASIWVLKLTDTINTDLRSSSKQLAEIANATQAAGNVMMTMMTMCNLAEMYMRQGQLNVARTMYEHALTVAVDDEGQPLPICSMAYLGLAELFREWGEFDTAQQYVEMGTSSAVTFSTSSNVEAYMLIARIHQSQGDYSTALSAYEKAAELAKAYKTSEIDDQFVELMTARLWIVQGKLDAVKQWMHHQGLEEPIDVSGVTSYYDYHIFHHEWLTVARLLLAEKHPARALEILNVLHTLMEKWGWRQSRREIELLVLCAVAYHALNRYESALDNLEIALTMAEPGGYVRTFLDEGSPVAELLERAVSRGIIPHYLNQLLNAFAETYHAKSTSLHTLPSPLSDREMEVLQLIAAGLTNPDIANRLFVAVGTVKAHTSSIYSKLNVSNRVQAIDRARELHLI